MRKRLAVLMILVSVMVAGCTGINSGVAVSVATDTAFVAALQNNPSLKPAVVSGLQGVKVFLTGRVTYDELIMQVSKQFSGQYAYAGIILTGYIETDKPVSTSVLPMLDSYKAAVVAKIDRLLLLSGTISSADQGLRMALQKASDEAVRETNAKIRNR